MDAAATLTEEGDKGRGFDDAANDKIPPPPLDIDDFDPPYRQLAVSQGENHLNKSPL